MKEVGFVSCGFVALSLNSANAKKKTNFPNTQEFAMLLGFSKLPAKPGGSSPTCWVIPLFWEPLLCRNVGVQPWLWENWFHGGSRRIWMGNWRDHPGDEKNRKTAVFSLPKMADNHLKFLNLKFYCKEADTKNIFRFSRWKMSKTWFFCKSNIFALSLKVATPTWNVGWKMSFLLGARIPRKCHVIFRDCTWDPKQSNAYTYITNVSFSCHDFSLCNAPPETKPLSLHAWISRKIHEKLLNISYDYQY